MVYVYVWNVKCGFVELGALLSLTMSHAKAVLREVELILTCKYCKETFENPQHLLHCGHTFCEKCLVAAERNDKGPRKCPLCGLLVSEKDSVRHLLASNIIQNILKIRNHINSTDDSYTCMTSLTITAILRYLISLSLHFMQHQLVPLFTRSCRQWFRRQHQCRPRVLWY